MTTHSHAMNTQPITLTINNIKHQRGGQLIVFVFFEEGFPKRHEQAIHKTVIPVTKDAVQVVIHVPSDAPFALKVLHDENMDGKVTKNWTGIIPYDGLGFSNGARVRFSPPKFKDAVIRHTPTMTPTITLQYF